MSTSRPAPRRALVLEDLPEVNAWLADLLPQCFDGIEVDTAATLAAARSRLSQAYDLALIDLALPDGNGTDMIRELSAAQPDCLVVVTTLFADDEFLLPALRAGAQGYLLKDQAPDKFAAALGRILDGEPPLSPAIAHRLLRSFGAAPTTANSAAAVEPQLTAREREVLTLTAKGYRLPEVAERLEVSRHTVSDHLKNIYRKLKVNTRAQATLEAARLGLVHQPH